MNATFVVGIAGGSASGKSTLCESLEAALHGLSVKAYHMDAYFKPKDKRPYSPAPVTGVMYVDDNHPQTADLPKMHGDIVKDIETGSFDVIIVEGLLTLYDKALYDLLDLKIFVDCKADERIVRRLRRNMGRGLGFEEIADVYLDMVRYRHDEYVEPTKWKADVIINGSSHSEAALDMLACHIKSKCTM